MAEVNLDKVISKLKEYSISEKLDCFVLSKGENKKFSPLTAKQQKDLLEAASSGSKAVFLYPKAVNNILLENSEDRDLLVSDRALVILGLRVHSFGPTQKIEREEGPVEVNLQKLLNDFDKSIEIKYKDSFSQGPIVLNCSIPTIEYENQLLDSYMKYRSAEFENDSKTQKLISEIYILELAKYITSVEINDKEPIILTLKDQTIAQKIRTVESLTATLVQKVMNFVTNVKNLENNLTTYKFEDQTIDINLDTSFFSNL
jgi:hypothetical protein